MNCDFCAEIGASTKAIGQIVNSQGVVMGTWCEQHAGRRVPKIDRKKQLASMMTLRRAEIGLSLSALARKLDKPRQQVSLWEQGLGVNLSSYLEWCDALGVLPSEMLARAGL